LASEGFTFETCSEVCAAVDGDLPCTIACEILGFDEFTELIERFTLDPIYYCELINVCPSDECEDEDCVVIKKWYAKPTSVRSPGTVYLTVFIDVIANWTGSGTISLDISTRGIEVFRQAKLFSNPVHGK